MENYKTIIHKSRYARWLEEEGRRETWQETVDRYCFNWKDLLTDKEYNEISNSILDKKVMPSMRAMWASGPALEKSHIAGYNCAFISVDSPRAFDEALYILMNGTGVGFGVEAEDVRKLPIVNDYFESVGRRITVDDSKEGWAKAVRKHVAHCYLGQELEWDYSKLRPAGTRLRTMGGRSSGPDPLKELLEFILATFKGAAGRKLTPMECHDIMCKIGEVVVVGGVRRSAMISLSDLGDEQIRSAKSGQWWNENPQRALANNSAVHCHKPDIETFMKEWISLIESKSGERGIYSRYGAQKMAPERRDESKIRGTNPCAEISLRSGQFCNLTEVVARQGDSVQDLKDKVRIATILGTLQATLTTFPYLRKLWTTNTEEERLLGVSLTGIQDCELLQYPTPKLLEDLREIAIATNAEWSARLGIAQAAAVTTIKPSGTVSQLVDSSSGIHGRFSPFYIRTIRQSKDDPLTGFLQAVGVPVEDDVMNPVKTSVFSFPMKSPDGAVMANSQSALEQLEIWKLYKMHWAEHSVSVTVYVKEHEWLEVGDWVYKNFDYLTGISFLPYSDHTYQQAPYQPISEEEYHAALSAFPSDIDWLQLSSYEKEDHTEGAKTLACTGGVCEI